MSDTSKPSPLRRIAMLLLKVGITFGLGAYVVGLIEWQDALYTLSDSPSVNLEGPILSRGKATLTLEGKEGTITRRLDAAIRLEKDGGTYILLSSITDNAELSYLPLNESFGEYKEGSPPQFNGMELLGAGDLPGHKSYLVEVGFKSIIISMGWMPPLVAFLMIIAIQILVAWRWYLLLRAIGINIPFLTAVKLNYIGLFFNNFLFGTTGALFQI